MSPDATPVVKEVSREDGRLLLCPQCGYDLRGLNGNRCPECGQEYDIACILPTVNAPVVDWFQAKRRLGRLKAAWKAAWLPAKAVSADAGRPAFGGLGIALHTQALILHAILFAGILVAWLVVEYLMAGPGKDLSVTMRGLTFSTILQATRVLVLLATSFIIAWAHFKLTDPARDTNELAGLAGVVFCWTLAAELLAGLISLAQFHLSIRGLSLGELVRSWGLWELMYYVGQAERVLFPRLQYCLLGASICRGLRALPNRKWRATVLVPVLVCAAAAVIDDYIMRGMGRLCEIVGLISSG